MAEHKEVTTFKTIEEVQIAFETGQIANVRRWLKSFSGTPEGYEKMVVDYAISRLSAEDASRTQTRRLKVEIDRSARKIEAHVGKVAAAIRKLPDLKKLPPRTVDVHAEEVPRTPPVESDRASEDQP
jgi:hypothetical protein